MRTYKIFLIIDIILIFFEFFFHYIDDGDLGLFVVVMCVLVAQVITLICHSLNAKKKQKDEAL